MFCGNVFLELASDIIVLATSWRFCSAVRRWHRVHSSCRTIYTQTSVDITKAIRPISFCEPAYTIDPRDAPCYLGCCLGFSLDTFIRRNEPLVVMACTVSWPPRHASGHLYPLSRSSANAITQTLLFEMYNACQTSPLSHMSSMTALELTCLPGLLVRQVRLQLAQLHIPHPNAQNPDLGCKSLIAQRQNLLAIVLTFEQSLRLRPTLSVFCMSKSLCSSFPQIPHDLLSVSRPARPKEHKLYPKFLDWCIFQSR
jgi:hypothetical protein